MKNPGIHPVRAEHEDTFLEVTPPPSYRLRPRGSGLMKGYSYSLERIKISYRRPSVIREGASAPQVVTQD